MLFFLGIEDYVVGYGAKTGCFNYKWNDSAFYNTNPLVRRADPLGCCAIVPNSTFASKMDYMFSGGGFVKSVVYDPDCYEIVSGLRYQNDFANTILAPKKLLTEFFGRSEDKIERDSGLFVYARSSEPYYIVTSRAEALMNSNELVNVVYIAEALLSCMKDFICNIDLIESYLSDM